MASPFKLASTREFHRYVLMHFNVDNDCLLVAAFYLLLQIFPLLLTAEYFRYRFNTILTPF